MVTTLTRASTKPLVNKTVLRQFTRELRKLGAQGGRAQYVTSQGGYNNHQRSWRYLIAQDDRKTQWLWTPQGILCDLVCDEWRQGRVSTKHSERYYYFPFVKAGREYVALDINDLLPYGIASDLRHLTASGTPGERLAAFIEEHADTILAYSTSLDALSNGGVRRGTAV